MHTQVAVFVDAGYLCTVSGQAAAGKPVSRRSIRIKIKEALEEIKQASMRLSGDRPLLRIYWYDACIAGTRKTAEHCDIAKQPDVKLRLGSISREGRQKGVDTMLVLDLMELAQNRAITDAIILGGDEDLRSGMIRAQALGVRVHLIGLEGLGQNQSHDLIEDADRFEIWPSEVASSLAHIELDDAEARQDVVFDAPVDPMILKAAEEYAATVNLNDIILYWENHDRGLPGDIDGRLLATARSYLGRDLVSEERRQLRSHNFDCIKNRIDSEKK